jgi:Uma2 family endonuclease
MTVGTIKMTANQFLQLGEDPPGVRLELVDGEVTVSPGPNARHSFVDTRLRKILGNHIDANDLGELYGDVDTIFGEHDVRRPNILFFSKERLHLIGEKAMEGPPDLCVEILSPSSKAVDRKQKFKQYEMGKVAHYWIIDPAAQTIEAYKLVRGKFKLSGKCSGEDSVSLPPFGDLEISLGELWWPRDRGGV